MTEIDYEQPVFTRQGDATVARMQRLLDDTAPRVWAALTTPDILVQWLAPGEIDLRLGGAAKLNFVDSGIVIDSKVSAFEDGRLL